MGEYHERFYIKGSPCQWDYGLLLEFGCTRISVPDLFGMLLICTLLTSVKIIGGHFFFIFKITTTMKIWWVFNQHQKDNRTNYNFCFQCFLPSWYLSADMQMFILSPLLLIPLSIVLNGRVNIWIPTIGLGLFNIIIAIVPVIINYQIDYKK